MNRLKEGSVVLGLDATDIELAMAISPSKTLIPHRSAQSIGLGSRQTLIVSAAHEV